MSFNKNYLNHNFQRCDKYNKCKFHYRCINCNILIEYFDDIYIEDYKYCILYENKNTNNVSYGAGILELTCEEIIIKNLIE